MGRRDTFYVGEDKKKLSLCTIRKHIWRRELSMCTIRKHIWRRVIRFMSRPLWAGEKSAVPNKREVICVRNKSTRYGEEKLYFPDWSRTTIPRCNSLPRLAAVT